MELDVSVSARNEGTNATVRSVAEVACDVLDNFKACLKFTLSLNSKQQALIQDQLARFSLWSSSIGIFALDRASIDYRLRDAQDIRDLVQDLLRGLVGTLDKCMSKLESWVQQIRTSEILDIAGIEGLSRDLFKLVQRCAADISLLHRLSNTIRKASRENGSSEAAPSFKIQDADGNNIEDALHAIFLHQLEDQFPRCEDTLRHRLASTMVLRRRRILYRRSRPNKTTKVPSFTEEHASQIVHAPHRSITALAQFNAHDPKDNNESPTNDQPPPLQNIASSGAWTDTILDVGRLRTPTASSTTSSAKTIHWDRGHNLSFPPAPRIPMLAQFRNEAQLRRDHHLRLASLPNYELYDHHKGQPPLSQSESNLLQNQIQDAEQELERQLEDVKIDVRLSETQVICPYCCQALSATDMQDQSKWQEHLKNDLDPYVCLFDKCEKAYELYTHSKPWLRHMKQHALRWACTAGPHTPVEFSEKRDYEEHLRNEHKDAFTDAQLSAIAERVGRPTGPLFQSCPLCGISDPDPNVTGGLEGHIVGHLRFLALKSLPLLDEEQEDMDVDLCMSAGSDSAAQPAGFDSAAQPAGTDSAAQPAGTDSVTQPVGSDSVAQIAGSDFFAQTADTSIHSEIHQDTFSGGFGHQIGSLQKVSALAAQTVRYAFRELERTITPEDARNFQSTTLKQVKSDVLKLEDELAARQSLRNLQRLAPFFQGLEHFAKAMDILCNGTPFLAWVWAPISLILRIASEHLEAFDLIIKGYSRIAECLGRFSVLSSSFKGSQNFQQTFSVFYADILEFHKHAYKFVRRRNWKLFFLTSWHRFQRQFDNIFENLQRHEALIDKEANAYTIAEAQQMRREIRAWREESDQKFEQNETVQSLQQFESIVSWLKFDESDQLQTFHALLEETTRYPGTCDWVLHNKKMRTMLQPRPEIPLLWVQGAAGTGKSVLASSIVHSANCAGSLILFHFCNHAYPTSTKYESILKSLLLQLVRKDVELAAHVFEKYVMSKKAPSLPVLETLLRFSLSSISKELRKTSYVWIVIDGIDECELLVQNKVFNLISQVTSSASNSDEVCCKSMIFCRFSGSASAKLRKSQWLSLTDEQQHVNMSIRRYAAQRLQSIYNKLEQLSLTRNAIREIEDAITEKANGMFLYARLALDSLSSSIFFSGEEIKASVYELPSELSELKTITQMLVRLDNRSVDRLRCALGWIAFSQRPLKKSEFLSAIVFSTGNTHVKHAAPQFLLDVCAPLIEEKSDSRLGFLHDSVKEFLQSPASKLVLKQEDCLLEHGIATVTCLLAGIQAFGKGLPDDPLLVEIIKGLHDFHIYSKEYWTEYLLSLLQPEIMAGSTTSTLFDMAFELAKKLNQLSLNPDDFQKAGKFPDERIASLQSPFLQTVINGCLQARSEEQLENELKKMEGREQSSEDLELSLIPAPQEGVSLISQKYQATIRYILNQPNYPGVTAAELESFKRHFRNCAYTCRVKGCIRATEGFESLAPCHQHEMLHVRRLRCTYPGCQHPPFVSSSELKAHDDKHHVQPPKDISRLGKNPPSNSMHFGEALFKQEG